MQTARFSVFSLGAISERLLVLWTTIVEPNCAPEALIVKAGSDEETAIHEDDAEAPLSEFGYLQGHIGSS